MPEARDWTTTTTGECPDCGYDASLIEIDGFDQALEFEGSAWDRWLGSVDDAGVRAHTVEGVWSALEYACHVRDLLAVFAARVDKMREGEQNPIEWWDHEASVVDDRYNEQVVADVADAIANNAMILSAATIGVDGDMWSRSAERRPGEVFTMTGLIRFALHESFHHRMDAVDAVSRATPS